MGSFNTTIAVVPMTRREKQQQQKQPKALII